MSTTETPSPSASDPPGPGAPGLTVVADQLRFPDGTAVECPASVLVAGELKRLEIPSLLGPVTVDHPATTARSGATFATVLPGGTGLGAHVQGGDGTTEPAVRACLARWVELAAPRTVFLASPRSFCAGVERAIAVVERALETHEGPIYVRKQIVHNTHVVAELQSRGAVFVEELDEVPQGATVVFSAHGVSPAVRTAASDRSLSVIDATCPLVTKVHAEARRYAGRGDTVVFIGHAGHEETEGTLGEAPEKMLLVQTADDVAALEVPDPSRVAYLTQTTLALDETAEVVEALKSKFPDLHQPKTEDICYATTNRQNAVLVVAAESELVLILGSTNSSNSVRLVELARRQGKQAYLIDDVSDIEPAWLDGVSTVGLSAGASAPPHLLDAVIAALGGLGPVTAHERETTRETIHFALPSQAGAS